MSFFDELKRRNVFRVGVAYIVASWVVLQVADLVFETINAPEWVLQALLFFVVLGFIACLVVAWAYEITPEGIKRESEIERGESITHETAAKLNRLTIALLILVVVAIAVDRMIPESSGEKSLTALLEESEAPAAAEVVPEQVQSPAETGDNRTSVAVLPFVNMSDDAQNEYFSDGISEELLNVLVKIESLRVPSRTSSFTFKDSKLKLSDIGRELGVDHVLEGSVRKAGSQIRVTAQLIDVNTDSHLWSETYTRELDDIFAVQDEISTAIVQALKVTLSGTDQQRMSSHGTANVEAYNKYLLGRHLWNKRGPQDLLDAVTPLQEAVALDPGYDQAWAALAETYVLIPEYGAGSMDQYIPLTREATEKALTINPASARALTARGYLKAMYEYDVDAALADFEQAITLDPTYPTARQWYGEILAVAGRIEDALEQISIAKELDPLATVIHHVEGWLLDHEGRDEEALKAYNNVHKIDPYKAHTYSNLSFLYARMGEFEKAREAERTWSELSGIDVTPILAVYDAMEDSSLKPAAIQLLQESDYYIDGASFVTPFYMLLGETELTLDSLERAFERGDPYAIHMQRFEIYDPLHDHPRFQALLRKMNLLP